MKTLIVALLSFVLLSTFAAESLALNTNEPVVLDTLSNQQQFAQKVESLLVYTSRWAQVASDLRDSLKVLRQQLKITSQSNIAFAVSSVVTNFSTIQDVLVQTAELTNVFIKPPQGLVAPFVIPDDRTDPHQRELLNAYYSARRSAGVVRTVHNEMQRIKKRDWDQSLESLVAAVSIDPNLYTVVRDCALRFPTNEFATTLSNRLSRFRPPRRDVPK